MIWLLLGALAVLALAPLAVTLLRPARLRGRGEADRALYRAQLAELEREREAGRLDATQFAAATLEVQRRILAAPAETPAEAPGQTPALLAALLFLIPAGGLGVYLLRGTPDMPAAPFTERQQQARAEDAMLEMLRQRVAALPAGSESARQGLVLLGNAERSRNRPEQAVEAWTRALAIRFAADLAGELAELQIDSGNPAAAGTTLAGALPQAPVDPRLRYLAGLAEARQDRPAEARRLWQALLADAPPGAPWRAVLERQLQALP